MKTTELPRAVLSCRIVLLSQKGALTVIVFKISFHYKLLWATTDMARPGGKAVTSGPLLEPVSQHIYIALC